MSRLPPSANIHFDATGVIVGADFGDTYFSRDDGLAESRAVFLAGNHLPEAWADSSRFVIAELGFGTGLNVLATWLLWNQTKPKGAILHIVTCEAFLMDAPSARRVHETWPELDALSQKLIARWPARAFGTQRLWFAEDNIAITILIGPCEEALSTMDFRADCWFLDGFAPSKNPDMWSKAAFSQIARLSAPGATVASYSVAGAVRANLTAIGFEPHRVAGFGAKRQRLEAAQSGPKGLAPRRPRSALVIGGGIGGSAVCDALSRRGLKVHVFDADPCGRTKASGNPVALIAPRLDRGETIEGRFYRSAYIMACDHYAHQSEDTFAPTGIIERGPEHVDKTRLTQLAQNPPLDNDHMVALEDGDALLHKKGGIAFPDMVLKGLKRDAIRYDVQITRIEQVEGQWQALAADGSCVAQADICVIAAGTGYQDLVDVGTDLRARAGQLSFAAYTGDLPSRPICGGAYAAPFAQRLVFGATYEPWPPHDQVPPPVSQAGHAHNLAILKDIAPELVAGIDTATLSGRSAIRVTTPDNLPLVGPAPSGEDGLYVVAGLGSRGFTTAFMCAEIIASAACHEPSPVEADITKALLPNRFLERAKRRGKK